MGFYTDLYATDEDLAIEAPGDFSRLIPVDQHLAQGSDGVFASGSPWIMTSATVDFAAQGVEAGVPVVLSKGSAFSAATTTNATSPDTLIISAVATGQITLRRKGFLASIGSPPGTSSTGNTGVIFKCPTGLPQLTEASRFLDQRYAHCADTFTASDYKRACVLMAMVSLYEAMSRQTDKDDYHKKALNYQKQLDAQLAILDAKCPVASESASRRVVVSVMPPTLLVDQATTDGFRYPNGYGG